MPANDTLQSSIEKAIREKNIHIEISERDLGNLALPPPFLCIANTALDDVDDLVLMKLLSNQGHPFRIISRKQKAPREFAPLYLPVQLNLLQWEEYTKSIFKHLTTAKKKGWNVCILLNFADNTVDAILREQLLNQLMKVILRAKLPIIPIRLKAPFRKFIRPALGSRLIQRTRKEPYSVFVRAGNTISVEEQQRFQKPGKFRRFIQSKIYALGSGLEVRRFYLRRLFKKPEHPEPVAPPVDPELIDAEINSIKFESLVASQGKFDIFVVRAKHIPHTLNEIGRLRELTFRNIGEGTGKSIDLDEYDLYYHQLLLWDREAKRIAGGYRMGLGNEIFNHYGASGFYISSLFKIDEGFYETMRQSVELGRSYIVPEYQKKRMPLFLLWKGILFFLLKNPHYRFLYGPVSISKFYSHISRSLIVAFIKRYYFNDELAQYLTPKKPFKPKVDRVDIEMLAENLDPELQALDSLIEDIEPQHIRIPVLVRQYLKLNARFISFNLDPNFSDVLDGFIILDLNDVPYSMIEALKKEGG
ncbi:MAG: GNAT family N-acyltransferase [Saprospiraceae bacterium]